jgi:hypothetical protein
MRRATRCLPAGKTRLEFPPHAQAVVAALYVVLNAPNLLRKKLIHLHPLTEPAAHLLLKREDVACTRRLLQRHSAEQLWSVVVLTLEFILAAKLLTELLGVFVGASDTSCFEYPSQQLRCLRHRAAHSLCRRRCSLASGDSVRMLGTAKRDTTASGKVRT